MLGSEYKHSHALALFAPLSWHAIDTEFKINTYAYKHYDYLGLHARMLLGKTEAGLVSMLYWKNMESNRCLWTPKVTGSYSGGF